MQGRGTKGLPLIDVGASLAALGLPGTAEMFAQAAAVSELLATRVRTAGSPTVSVTAADLMRHPGLFEWGATERLLRIAEAYLSLPVAYDGLCYFHSAPDGSEGGVRCWHLDREDRRMIKMGVYISDVGESDGPLQVMPRDLTSRIDPVALRYKPFPHQELERRLGAAAAADAVTTITGPPGTVVITDTAQHFHRGSPPTARARSAIYFSYFSRTPRHPFFCERSPFSRAQLATLAETLTPFQRECVLWRATLPPSAKWLPRSLV